MAIPTMRKFENIRKTTIENPPKGSMVVSPRFSPSHVVRCAKKNRGKLHAARPQLAEEMICAVKHAGEIRARSYVLSNTNHSLLHKRLGVGNLKEDRSLALHAYDSLINEEDSVSSPEGHHISCS